MSSENSVPSRKGIGVKATFVDEAGEPQIRQFASLYQAGKAFGLYPRLVKMMIEDPDYRIKHSRPLPKDLRFELCESVIRPNLKIHRIYNYKECMYHCEICDKTMKRQSKYSHVLTGKHLKKLETKNN